MNVICTVCEKSAKFNSTLGVYFCPRHGYETKLEDPEEYMVELASNLEQMKVFA